VELATKEEKMIVRHAATMVVTLDLQVQDEPAATHPQGDGTHPEGPETTPAQELHPDAESLLRTATGEDAEPAEAPATSAERSSNQAANKESSYSIINIFLN